MADLETLIANMTIADLARLGGKTPSEIAAFALSGATATKAPRTASRANGAPERAPRGTLSTRTTAGRSEFDNRVLETLRAAGGPVSSQELESQVGGTPMQRRAALKRLVAARKIKRAGMARATTYEAR